jgi:hypothetical protein
MNKCAAASMKPKKNIMANWRLWVYLRLVRLEEGFSVYHRFGTFGASWNKYILRTLGGFSLGGQFDIMPKTGGFKERLPAQIIESWSQPRGVLLQHYPSLPTYFPIPGAATIVPISNVRAIGNS